MRNIFFLFLTALFCFCQPPPAHPNDPVDENADAITSWEVYEADTINRLDSKGRKQGKWIRFSQGKAEDTSFYKDGIRIDGRKE